MTDVSIYWHGDLFEHEAILELFKESVNKFSLISSTVLPSNLFTPDLLTVNGINLDWLIHRLHSAEAIDSSSDGMVVLVTNTRISAQSRIFFKDNICIVSLHGLAPEATSPRGISTLIYSVLVGAENALAFCTSFGFCALHPSKYSTWLPTDISEECKCKLVGHGALEALELNKIFSAEPHNGNLVLILHGIRTFAEWAPSIEKQLRQYNFLSGTQYYGLINTVGLVLNPLFGFIIRDKFYSFYKHEISKRKNIKVSVIAHSWGTEVIARALNKYTDIKLDKVILVNSIIKRNYDWGKIFDRGQVQRVLNECSGNDVWPIVADKLIIGCGDSGYTFFDRNTKEVVNVLHAEADHSSLLTAGHCDEMWIPFITEGSDWHPGTASTRNWLRFFSWLPGWGVKFVVYTGLIFVIYKLLV